ncbi:MAG: type VI secretion system Vgr family protein [Sandaracinaceae bacterium]
MGDTLQQTRFYFESSGLDGVLIEPTSVQIIEALGEPYGAELELSVGDPAADLALMLGNDCVLSIEREGSTGRRLCGVVRAVHEGDLAGENSWARVVVVPGLWFLSRRRDTRIFQDKTVPEILEEVLGALSDYGRKIENALSGSYDPREYCVQYGETDLDFCHRLMEEEGIYYAFDHEGAQETMVLRDANQSAEPAPTVNGDGVVPYRQTNAVFAAEPVHLVERAHRATTTAVMLRDWDWTKASEMTLEAETPGEDAKARTRESYEHGEGRSIRRHSYAGVAYGGEDSAHQAPMRSVTHHQEAQTLHAIGRVVGLAPGVKIELVDHPVIGLDGTYLVTRVRHADQPAETLLGGGAASADNYRNIFECIPIDREFRLPRGRSAKPRIDGIQTAVVTGPAGEEIHVDEHGRIKVQFHWDRLLAADAHSSCWIRVEQAWAGPSWGFWYVPRIGMEVVVQFVDGDPDRPLVTGAVYNASNPTPYGLPDEKTKSTIKSDSSLGHTGFSGKGFNEFRFEDLAGEEEIFTHAEKDYNEVVENDHSTLVHRDQSNTVDNDQTQLVKNDQSEHVQGNQTMTVGGNRTVHVKNNFDETVDGTETRTVVGDVQETFDANETRTIKSNVKEDIAVNETRNVDGSQSETIKGNQSRTVTMAESRTITGALEQSVTAGITSTTPAAHAITATAGFSISTPAGINFVAPAGAQIIAPGGITHLDSFDTELCGMTINWSAFGKEFFALKIEAAGASFGLTSFKVEVGAMACETSSAFHTAKGTELTNGPITLRQRINNTLNGLYAEG